MKRYHITEGARTTAGGKVVAATSAVAIDGVRGALEGDPLYCPACKSAGKIKCVGPRIPETWDGKPVALSDDLCLCGCPTPPKLLPNQTRKFQSAGGFSEPDPKFAETTTLENSGVRRTALVSGSAVHAFENINDQITDNAALKANEEIVSSHSKMMAATSCLATNNGPDIQRSILMGWRGHEVEQCRAETR